MNESLSDRIFNLKDEGPFLETALEIYGIQSVSNDVFNEYISCLQNKPGNIKSLREIPFLPIGFFRNRRVVTGGPEHEIVFESSATTDSVPSRHYVHDLQLYEASFLKAFRLFYGEPSEYFIAALLPSYTERGNSSLVYMMNTLIRETGYPGSGFYRDNYSILINDIEKARVENRKTLILGVSFALLDLASDYSPDLSGTIVMETGGMKGRRKEIIREELHEILCTKFRVAVIHSEYGMTELLSQAYSAGGGVFRCPPWMKVMIRDPHDPLSMIREPGVTGGINIIDLANIHSCSFIATGDLGRLHDDGSFEVLGRFDNSEIRGCNLMI